MEELGKNGRRHQVLRENYPILSNDSRPAQQDSGAPACFCVLRPCFGALLELSVGLFASVERFVLELGPSDLDFARLDSPRDGLDVVFGSRNGVICKVSGERTGFVASIDFSYDFHAFSKLFFDRLISQFSIMSSIVCAFDRKRLRWLKPRKTQAGATKIKVRRSSGS